ncbi:MAG: alpha/beta hydrolase [Pseudomonadales bacterium]
MAQLSIADAVLDCAEAGDGPQVLLIHGSASDARTWDAQFDDLAQTARVIRYSRRFHWPNPPPAVDADYSMAQQVDDLGQVIEALQLRRPHLVGHSYGAYLALMYALRRPDDVASLVLAEPPVIPLVTAFPPGPADVVKLLLTDPRTALPLIRFAATGLGPATAAIRRGDRERALAKFGSAVFGAPEFAALSAERLEQARINFHSAELLSERAMLPIDAAAVERLECPVLLVTGAWSPKLFVRLVDRLAALLPHADRVRIPRASHNMHERNPAAFNAAVSGFIARCA